MQESLLRCLGPWRRARLPAEARAYVRAAMTRQALRWRRSRQAYATHEPAVPEPCSDHAENDAVRQALRTLPMPQRAVLVLRFYDGLSESEIADALQIPPGTVNSRTSRALVALRAGGLLDPHQTDPDQIDPDQIDPAQEAPHGRT